MEEQVRRKERRQPGSQTEQQHGSNMTGDMVGGHAKDESRCHVCLLACKQQRPVLAPRQVATKFANHMLLRTEDVASPFGTASFTHSFIECTLDAKGKDIHTREETHTDCCLGS